MLSKIKNIFHWSQDKRALKLGIFRILIFINFLEARSQQNWKMYRKQSLTLIVLSKIL